MPIEDAAPFDEFRERWDKALDDAYSYYNGDGTRGSHFDPARSDDWITRHAADQVYYTRFAVQQGRMKPGTSMQEFIRSEEELLRRKPL
ncbi:MAG: hypothetical protein HY369_01485 [Candidatus Aenigmarchaeota archaeon]|nr:hypothetical protein [Candidatus Aenigmarchaeota archaeon]